MGEERLVLGVLQSYPRGVRMVYHPYPGSDQGWVVARGLEAAGEQGKFWEVHDLLLSTIFAEMTEADVEARIVAVAQEVGLNVDELRRSMNSSEVKDRLAEARQQAIDRGVGHPSMYVNGKEFIFGANAADDLRSTIDKELGGLAK